MCSSDLRLGLSTAARSARRRPPSIRRRRVRRPGYSAGRTTRQASLTAADHAYVTRLCGQCPALGTARVLAAQFAAMCRTRDANALTPWLESARGTEFQAFVSGIDRDRDAVLAALCFRWSTSQVEGHPEVEHRMEVGRASCRERV